MTTTTEQTLSICPGCNRPCGERPVLTIARWRKAGTVNPFTDVVHSGCRHKVRPHRDWIPNERNDQ